MVDSSPSSWHGLDTATVRRIRTKRWTWAQASKAVSSVRKGKKFKQLWCALGSHECLWGFTGDVRTSFSSAVSLVVF